MADKYVSGYPPPPYYFEEYVDADEQVGQVEDTEGGEGVHTDAYHLLSDIKHQYNIYDVTENTHVESPPIDGNEKEKYTKQTCHLILGRPPPVPLKSNYNVFGINHQVEKRVEDLESDELLYDVKKNLKNEFIRLFKKYKESIFDLFDDIVNNRRDDKTKIKILIKVHVNLFHILAKLRFYQCVNNIINVLKVQLKRRQIAIDKMKLSLLRIYGYIHFVQGSFSTRAIADDDEGGSPKRRRKLTVL
ncbi:RNA polymerase II mediator complex protein MED7 [Plasmodium cynomolgi strain B]|uniref:Mediator of RNA polymerase II transcription subunit 7 n=1 Tax=Plasmodium cynomolgi (strain B) TaxID=1120755 RepID=K6UIN8_PLACD|nr:RNA polymerase II mediator complex protein MED7 [Plasmodium cynomolgi strain B]GAB65173.1 RNA polymerase II mediator complex protein MED7 [Plasmodium cynomolgi strain B]